MDKRKLKKIGSLTLSVILYVFLAIALIFVVLTVFAKKDADGTTEIFGKQMRLVVSNSMEKCEETDVSDFDIKSIPLHSAIFVETVPEDGDEANAFYKALKEGDVLTFRYVYAKQVTITHRITSIREKATGGYIIELAGDNKNADADQLYQVIDTSAENSMNYVIGRVTGSSYLLGLILTVLRSTVGLILVVIVPCLVIIALEVIKIVRAFSAEKKKKALAESEKKDAELAALRKKLAELEGQSEGARTENEKNGNA